MYKQKGIILSCKSPQSKETLLSMHKKLSARKFCPATQTRLAWLCDEGVRSVGRSATTRGSRRAQTV